MNQRSGNDMPFVVVAISSPLFFVLAGYFLTFTMTFTLYNGPHIKNCHSHYFSDLIQRPPIFRENDQRGEDLGREGRLMDPGNAEKY